MRYLPLIIGFSVAYVAGVIGLFFAFEGWIVFFSVVGFTLLTFGLLAYTIYRSVRNQIQEQMQNMQGMMAGMANAMAGADKNVIDVVAQTKYVKDNAGNLLTTSVATATTVATAARVMDATKTDTDGNVTDLAVEVAEAKGESSEQLSLNPFSIFAGEAGGEGEDGDIQVMMAQMMSNMTPEQKKAAEDMAMQMMQMFMGGGNGEGSDLQNLFGLDEKETEKMLAGLTPQEQPVDVEVKEPKT